MKRKQNIFLFLTEQGNLKCEKRMDCNLVRIYVNNWIIDEEDQNEIQAVIPLMEDKPDTREAKEKRDKGAIIEQLDRFAYDFFLGEIYVTHFILVSPLLLFSTISPWIYRWFNKQAVKKRHLKERYRFVCTTLAGSKRGVCSKQDVLNAYEQFSSEMFSYYVSTSNQYQILPIDMEMEKFEQTITADELPISFEQRLINFHEIYEIKDFVFYPQLTDSEVKKMSEEDLNKCRSLGLKPDLHNIYRKVSGRRHSFIIFPKREFEKTGSAGPLQRLTQWLTNAIAGNPNATLQVNTAIERNEKLKPFEKSYRQNRIYTCPWVKCLCIMRRSKKRRRIDPWDKISIRMRPVELV